MASLPLSKTGLGGTIAGLLAVGVLAAYSDLVFTLSHSLVNIFAGGRSFTKVFLFLGWAIGLLVIVGFKKTSAWKIGSWHKCALASVVLAAYLLNVGTLIWFSNQYGLNLSAFTITSNNGELSTNKLLHAHTLKGTIGSLLAHTPYSVQENIDNGLAYVGLVPGPVYILSAILLIGLLVLLVWHFTASWQGYKRPIIYALAYAIISFSLVKNILDGGLLNHEAMVSLAWFGYLLFQPAKLAKIWTAGALAVYLIFLGVCYWLGIYENFSHFSYQVYITLVYSGLLFGLVWLASGNAVNRVGRLYAVLIALMLYYPLAGDLSIIKYHNLEISPDDGAVVALFKDPGSEQYQPIAQVGNLVIYQFHPTAPTKVKHVLRENTLLDNLFPVSLPWETCLPNGQPKVYTFTLASSLKFSPQDWQGKIFVRSTEVGYEKGLYRYNVTMSFPDCWPRDLNIMAEYFYSNGLQTYFITNLVAESEWTF